MTQNKISIFAWLSVIFVINIGILFMAMTYDDQLSNKVVTDIGEELRDNFNLEITQGGTTEEGRFLGLAYVVGNSTVDTPTSLQLSDDDVTISNQKTKETSLGFLEGILNFARWAGKISAILGFIVFGLGIAQFYLLAWSSTFPIWGYAITLPIFIQTARLIAKIFFPNRVD